MRTTTRILLSCCLVLAFAGAAGAQQAPSQADVQNWMGTQGHGTPDGVPPSGETVCNGLVGDAHGLCTAYCEAMDCDSGAPQASQTACTKVRNNFIKHTGQAPPCDCPCVAQFPGFIDALNSITSQDSCFSGPFIFSANLTVVFTPSGFEPAVAVSPDISFAVCGNFQDGSIPITVDQGQACINLIVQKATAAGLSCTSTPNQ